MLCCQGTAGSGSVPRNRFRLLIGYGNLERKPRRQWATERWERIKAAGVRVMTVSLLQIALVISVSLNVIVLAKALWPLCRLFLVLAIWIWRYALWGWRFERVLLSVINNRRLRLLRSISPLTPTEWECVDAEIKSRETLRLALMSPLLDMYFSDTWRGPRGPRWSYKLTAHWRLFRFAEKPSEFRRTLGYYKYSDTGNCPHCGVVPRVMGLTDAQRP